MKVYAKIFGIMGFALTLFSGCGFSAKDASVAPAWIVINVLDKSFYEDCHIDAESINPKSRSLNIPFENIEEYVSRQSWDKKNTGIVVYCANYKCTASGEAAKKFKEMGFDKVFAYEGGVAEWLNKGYPVKGACKEGYLSDFEKPEQLSHDVPTITAEELMQALKDAQ